MTAGERGAGTAKHRRLGQKRRPQRHALCDCNLNVAVNWWAPLLPPVMHHLQSKLR